jgi:tetratricopeptide (TPR) repeat protein
LPGFDVHAPLLSLPYIFGTVQETIPAAVPYVAPPPSRYKKIDALSRKQINIGVVWAGSPTHTNDANRSCDAEYFQQLMDVPGFSWYSLQKGSTESRSETSKYLFLLKDLSPFIHDFADTAALIDQLDLVITVDTAVAHLAGAMGKPVWVLLPFVPDWRWMMNRMDSPWYPTMLLFRQTRQGDWQGVFTRVKDALKNVHTPEFQAQVQEADKNPTAGGLRNGTSPYRNQLVQKRLLAEASYIRSKAARRQNQAKDALDHLNKACEIDPSSVVYPFELGCLHHDMGRFDEALASYDRALELRQDLAPIHNNKGNILKLLGRFPEAVRCYEQAANLNSDSPEIHTNMGVALADQRLLDEAEKCYQRALSLNSDHASAHWNLSLLLLMKGDYELGWQEYEWRRQVRNYIPYFSIHKKPGWQGEGLEGRTLLLHYEQGLGDTLQFIRYAPLAAARGGRVIIQCQPELVRLLKMSGTTGEIVGSNGPLPDHDIQCSLMSLPHVFRTTLDSIPSNIPYLHPDKILVREWGKRIKTDGFKVGLVWAGKLWDNIPAAKSIDRRRSLNFDLLSPITSLPDITFYSLQMGGAAKQMYASAGSHVIDITGDIKDFADTAAIIAHLDLVICVDTSIAHLAGAMGKAVWVLSRYDGCWRWLLDREDSPWYPTLRLFRQTKPGNWDDVVEYIAKELRKIRA